MKGFLKKIIAGSMVLAFALPISMAALAPSVAFAEDTSSGTSQSLLQKIKKQNKDVSDLAGLSSGATSETPMLDLIGKLIGAAIGVLGIVFVMYFIYAGYLWMTAQGNSGQVDKAKEIMKTTVVGLIILMASYVIASFVMTQIKEAIQPGVRSGTYTIDESKGSPSGPSGSACTGAGC